MSRRRHLLAVMQATSVILPFAVLADLGTRNVTVRPLVETSANPIHAFLNNCEKILAVCSLQSFRRRHKPTLHIFALLLPFYSVVQYNRQNRSGVSLLYILYLYISIYIYRCSISRTRKQQTNKRCLSMNIWNVTVSYTVDD